MTLIEWCRENDIWYLKIDLDIPEACIKEAQNVYDEGFFVPHRLSDGDGGHLLCMVLYMKVSMILFLVGVIQ